MSLEKKVYSEWAFTRNEREKSKINKDIYQALKVNAKQFYRDQEPTKEEMQQFMCYKCLKHGYARNTYTTYSNPNKLSLDELALICDSGNLCFGYSGNSKAIVIYTD